MQWLCRVEIPHGNMSGAIAKNAKESESSRTVGAGVGSMNDRGAPTANSGDAARTVTITIFQSHCADARTDTRHSERADGFTDGNGSTGTQNAKWGATE